MDSISNKIKVKFSRQRLDQWLVENGFASSRHKAQALILAGQVIINDQRAEKSGQLVPSNAKVRIRGQGLKYVGRGGLKLEGALQKFSIDVKELICLDIGASTGGFTDCLLQHGAAHVYAIDVGHNQLAWELRSDHRISVREGINARYLTPEDFTEKFHLITCDLSFISLDKILPVLPSLLAHEGKVLVLVKPQFEVGRLEVGKGGIVRDPKLHRRSVENIIEIFKKVSLTPERVMKSPIEGAEGNIEFLVLASNLESSSTINPIDYNFLLNKDLKELF